MSSTDEDWYQVIDSIKVVNLSIGLVYFKHSQSVRVSSYVKDIHDGERTLIHTEWKIEPFTNTFDKKVRWVRKLIQELLLHELDECLLVSGQRIFDPHK
jgi:hypothetical protein